MAYQGIGTGITPNDNNGDSLLTGAVKINSNFKEIYTALGDGNVITIDQKIKTENLLITGLSTFQGLVQVDTGIVPDKDKGAYLGTQLLPFSQAHIGEVHIAPGNSDNKITTTSGNLVLDSAEGLVDINDSVDISGTLDVTGATTLKGLVDINDSVDISGTLDVTGATTLKGLVQVDTGIVPDKDKGAYLGTQLLPFSQAHIGEVHIAPGNSDNKITTTSGNLVLDSAEGLVDINDSVDISGTLDVTGATTLKGDVDLGNENTDTVTFTARVDSNVIPSGLRNLGSSNNSWDNVYANAFHGNGTIPLGGIIMWSGSTIPTGWAICNGNNGTPDLRNRFVICRGTSYPLGSTGGSKDAIVVKHEHFVASSTGYTTDESAKKELTSTDYVSHIGRGGSGNTEQARDYTLERSTTESNVGRTNSVGSSGENANLPPYYALAFIMRTA